MCSVQVMLSPAFDQTFRRCVRDSKGEILEILTFVRGEIVKLPPELLPAIQRDLGKALLVVIEKDGKLVTDREASLQLAKSINMEVKDPEPTAEPEVPEVPAEPEPVADPTPEPEPKVEPEDEFAEAAAPEVPEPAKTRPTKKKKAAKK